VYACLPEELHVCIKKLKRGKSPGIDGVSADMVIDGGDLLHTLPFTAIRSLNVCPLV